MGGHLFKYMHKIEDKLTEVLLRIRQSALKVGRNPDEITLLAVSKTQPAANLRRAYDAGQRHFGENYLREALGKIEQLRGLDIVWHFIGPIQSNKTRAIAEHFAWVHSVDRLKIAQRLNEQRPESMPPLNVCVQVNIDREATKSGAEVEEVHDLALAINTLSRLRLRGLMAIPAPGAEKDSLHRLMLLYEKLKTEADLRHLDTLSMGMSADMETAITNGSTIVRIGTAIFGARD